MASHLGSEILGSENIGSENPEMDRGCDLPGEGGPAGGKENNISILVVVVKNILSKEGGPAEEEEELGCKMMEATRRRSYILRWANSAKYCS